MLLSLWSVLPLFEQFRLKSTVFLRLLMEVVMIMTPYLMLLVLMEMKLVLMTLMLLPVPLGLLTIIMKKEV